MSEIAAQSQVHVQEVQAWKTPRLEPAATVFTGGVKPMSLKEAEEKQAELFEPIGRLKMEWKRVRKSG